MPAMTGAIVLLQVFDMPRAITFYCDMLDFEIYHHSPFVETAEGRFFHWAWLRNGPVELMLNTAYDANERPPVADAARWAGHGDVSLSLGCADVDAVYAELLAKGLAPAPPRTSPHGPRELSLRDPDGYELCFRS
ncbi:MAG: VOC family protein [Sphingomonas sp.]